MDVARECWQENLSEYTLTEYIKKCSLKERVILALKSQDVNKLLFQNEAIWNGIFCTVINHAKLLEKYNPNESNPRLTEKQFRQRIWLNINSVTDFEVIIFWMFRTKDFDDIDDEIEMNQFMKKLGEIVKQIIFWKGEPGLYVTRGFMKIFDQLFFTLLPHYEGIRHLAVDSCYVFYNHWNAMMNLEEDGSFTISRVRYVDYDLSFYHFDKKVLGMVKYHTKHANNHSDMCALNHHYTECHTYLHSAGIVGDRSVEH